MIRTITQISIGESGRMIEAEICVGEIQSGTIQSSNRLPGAAVSESVCREGDEDRLY